MNRRELLKWMAVTGGAVAAPHWIWAAPGAPSPGERLVLIFLRGAADGLTICAPLAETAYFDARPTLAVPESDALPLDAFFGLHPAASGIKNLFDEGDLAIVHATGLATAQRSHFEAQAAMEQGIDSIDVPPADGWLARYLDRLAPDSALAAVALDKAIPQSMSGAASALAVGEIDEFSLNLDARAQWALGAAYTRDPLLYSTASAALTAADALAPVTELPPGEGYPAGPLGTALADTARLIRSDKGLIAAAVNAGGWDHHDNQNAQIEPILAGLSDALLAFRADLADHWASTTVVIQTEFGRRVAENASAGTDYGHGGVMLLAGGGVNGGAVHTDWPGLAPADLSAGEDLAVTIDYRQVLAEMLALRFGVDNPGEIFPGWTPQPWRGIFVPAGPAESAPVGNSATAHHVVTAAGITTRSGSASLDLSGLPERAADIHP